MNGIDRAFAWRHLFAAVYTALWCGPLVCCVSTTPRHVFVGQTHVLTRDDIEMITTLVDRGNPGCEPALISVMLSVTGNDVAVLVEYFLPHVCRRVCRSNAYTAKRGPAREGREWVWHHESSATFARVVPSCIEPGTRTLESIMTLPRITIDADMSDLVIVETFDYISSLMDANETIIGITAEKNVIVIHTVNAPNMGGGRVYTIAAGGSPRILNSTSWIH